jgi:glycosyltransferase involved in cell wall biosynthesis
MRKIAVGIITYKRPQGLEKLLESLRRQDTRGLEVAVRILVVDNDPESNPATPTQQLLARLRQDFPCPLDCSVEKNRGIASARNAVVRALKDEEALLFIDDDETAPPGWLRTLLAFWQAHPEADLLTGPVAKIFPSGDPRLSWTAKSWFFSPERFSTGEEVNHAYTSNLLLTRKVWQTIQPLFDTQFDLSGGSDAYMNTVVGRHGFRILWVQEALVTEEQPDHRASLGWVFRRGLRCGGGRAYIERRENMPRRWPTFVKDVLKGARAMMLGILTGNKARRLDGTFVFSYGLGGILGTLFGYRYHEYKKK